MKQFKFPTKSDNFIWEFNELNCIVLEINSLRRTLHWPADGSWHVCEMWRCPVGTGTHTHSRTHTPNHTSPTSIPLTTAAVLQEAAIPLADQILSVTFPLINGHLLPPFSLHGYTLSLCSSNHLIVVTFNLIWASPPRLCSPAWLLMATTLPTCHTPAGETQGHANKQADEATIIWKKNIIYI